MRSVSSLRSWIFLVCKHAFFNNNSIPYDPTILGYADVKINPFAGLTSQRLGDSIKITMPNSMGQDLFGLIIQTARYYYESNYFPWIF